MASSIIVTAPVVKACSRNHVSSKRPLIVVGTKQAATHIVTPNIKAENGKNMNGLQKPSLDIKADQREEASDRKFIDSRWKEGTWDLNMFVKKGKMDWDGVIVAEARRRKFLEMHPAVSTNHEPVLFRTSIIPWWAWIMHSHLPEAELLNGRAAMMGFFMGYVVDILTGLDVVGQTGNFICKAGLFFTIMGVLLFRRAQDIENLKKLADEATFYDKQWQASWQQQHDGSPQQKRR